MSFPLSTPEVLVPVTPDGRPVAPTTACIPTIPPRAVPGGLLLRAMDSVRAQTVAPAGGMVIAMDLNREGAAATRQRALDLVTTDFVSFLDDDDIWHPHHLKTHVDLLHESGADVAYSWFDGNNPFPAHRGRVYDPAEPHHLTMTLTVRTELAKAVGFGRGPLHEDWAGEDWAFQLGLRDLGATFVGTGLVTWTYDAGHGGNTSGLPGRW
jgi:hypothetical protein